MSDRSDFVGEAQALIGLHDLAAQLHAAGKITDPEFHDFEWHVLCIVQAIGRFEPFAASLDKARATYRTPTTVAKMIRDSLNFRLGAKP